VLVRLLLDPQPACRRTIPNKTAKKAPSNMRRFREMPAPINPNTGSQIA